ncbi:MAG: hypothetical protein RR400_01170 [Clostridia bacterium]
MEFEVLDMQNEEKFHRVLQNESAKTISNLYYIPIDFLKKNNFDCKFLEGDLIVIPFSGSICHVVKPLETINTIAEHYGKSLEFVQKFNMIEKVFIGQRIFL